MLKQTAAVTRMNLENLGSRAGSSTTVIVGSAAVVAVLLGLLAMSAGFRSALVETAKPDRGLILRNGATTRWTAGSVFRSSRSSKRTKAST